MGFFHGGGQKDYLLFFLGGGGTGKGGIKGENAPS